MLQGAGFYRDDQGHGSYACKLRKDENYEYMCDIVSIQLNFDNIEEIACFFLLLTLVG